MAVLLAISFSHFLNDTIQSLIPAIYPMLKTSFALDFGQIGLITLTFQLTASLLQPLVGIYTDKRPLPYSLAFGMGLSLLGLLLLSVAWSFPMLLAAAALVGMGSSVFHPESSRVARMASGGRHGFAQSVFQVGGNAGSAVGPLLAAFIVLQRGQSSVAWFSIIALLAMVVLWNVGTWYKRNRAAHSGPKRRAAVGGQELPRARVVLSLAVLCALVFSKFFYMASMTSYFTFYLMSTFHVSVQSAQIYLFVFLFAVAAGVVIGGPIGDRLGRKLVIWVSILGVLPFTLALPYANLLGPWCSRSSSACPGLGLLRRSWSTRRSWCPGRSAWSPASSSASPSAWAASAPPCWASSPTGRASATSTISAPSCRRSAFSPPSCPISGTTRGPHARGPEPGQGCRPATRRRALVARSGDFGLWRTYLIGRGPCSASRPRVSPCVRRLPGPSTHQPRMRDLHALPGHPVRLRPRAPGRRIGTAGSRLRCWHPPRSWRSSRATATP